MLGYDNYVELGYYRMNRNSYDKDMVKAYRDQVKKYFVPFATKMHERRRERLGLEKLKYYDNEMYFINGNPAPKGTPEGRFLLQVRKCIQIYLLIQKNSSTLCMKMNYSMYLVVKTREPVVI